jgi:hypothetical protein
MSETMFHTHTEPEGKFSNNNNNNNNNSSSSTEFYCLGNVPHVRPPEGRRMALRISGSPDFVPRLEF